MVWFCPIKKKQRQQNHLGLIIQHVRWCQRSRLADWRYYSNRFSKTIQNNSYQFVLWWLWFTYEGWTDTQTRPGGCAFSAVGVTNTSFTARCRRSDGAQLFRTYYVNWIAIAHPNYKRFLSSFKTAPIEAVFSCLVLPELFNVSSDVLGLKIIVLAADNPAAIADRAEGVRAYNSCQPPRIISWLDLLPAKCRGKRLRNVHKARTITSFVVDILNATSDFHIFISNKLIRKSIISCSKLLVGFSYLYSGFYFRLSFQMSQAVGGLPIAFNWSRYFWRWKSKLNPSIFRSLNTDE